MTFDYTADGRLHKRTDAKDREFYYDYDRFNRVTRVYPPLGSSYAASDPRSWSETTAEYGDHRGNKTGGSSSNRIATHASFDWVNRPLTRTDTIFGRNYTTTFSHNDWDQLEWILYPSGRKVMFAYNDANQVTDIWDDTTGVVYATGITYLASGAVGGYVSGDGRYHTMTEDGRGRPQVVTHPNWSLEYHYDPAGNVSEIRDTRPRVNGTFDQFYHYDVLQRVKSGSGVWGTYEAAYDPLGNLTEKKRNGASVLQFTMDHAKQRLASVNDVAAGQTITLDHNAVGELAARTIGSSPLDQYEYTPSGLLARETRPGAVSDYFYDSDDMRSVKIDAGTTTDYARGPGGQMVGEYREQGGTVSHVRDYVYLNGKLLAGVTGLTKPSCTGSVIAPNRWAMNVYGTTLPEGTAAMTTDDGDSFIIRRWRLGSSPALNCGIANGVPFSVAWHRQLALPEGNYEFKFHASGGALLDILRPDNTHEVRDHLALQATPEETVPVRSDGLHPLPIVFKFVHWGQPGVVPEATLTWSRTDDQPPHDDIPPDHWAGEYFVGITPGSDHTGWRHDDGEAKGGLSFTWPASPCSDGCGILSTFSARWKTTVTLPGPRRLWFSLVSDDGARIKVVDNQERVVVDQWAHTGLAGKRGTTDTLPSGVYTIVVEYFNLMAPGTMYLRWGTYDPAACNTVGAADHWNAEFTPEPAWSTAVPYTRDDGNGTGFSWLYNTAARDCTIPGQGFYAQWTRTVALTDGNYRFSAAAAGNWQYLMWRPNAQSPDVVGQYGDGWESPNPVAPADLHLLAGTYKFEFKYLQQGTGASASASVVRLPDPPANLAVRIVKDLDRNGNQDDLEPFLKTPENVCSGVAKSGVTVSVSGPTGASDPITVSGTLSACSDGFPQFSTGELRPGTYTVSISGLDTWSGAKGASVTLAPGANAISVFPLQPPLGQQVVHVVMDGNGNGEKDAGEAYATSNLLPCTGSTAIDGLTVRWILDRVTVSERPATCGSNGAYFVATGLTPSDAYQVRATLPTTGWTVTRTVNAAVTEDGESEAWIYVRPPCIDTVASTRWKAEYFSGTTPGSGLLAVRDEGDNNTLAHDWGTGSPCSDCGVPVDNFSARFTRTITFAAGWYVFTARGDDGLRLYVDGVLRINGWTDHGPTTFTSAPLSLSAGAHTLQLEYYDHTGEAMVVLTYAATPPPPGNLHIRVYLDWNGDQYFNGNDSIVTTPTNPCTSSNAVDGFRIDWSGPSSSYGSPNYCEAGVGAWTGADGVPSGTYTVSITLPPGFSLVAPIAQAVVAGDTRWVNIWVRPPACLPALPSGDWHGDFFATPNQTGPVLMTRSGGNGALWQNWGIGSPGSYCGIPQDNFSVQWWRDVNFEAGVYRFTATGDDGVRIVIDGRQVVNGWWDHTSQSFTGDVAMTAGVHRVYVDYYERTGEALVGAQWQWVSPLPQPPGTLFPNQRLSANQQLWSPNGNYFLVYQGDGNLVLYTWYGEAMWQAQRANTDPGELVMQGDGNLVIYNGWGDAIWWTDTYGNAGAYLAVQDDGNLVIYNADRNRALWSIW